MVCNAMNPAYEVPQIKEALGRCQNNKDGALAKAFAHFPTSEKLFEKCGIDMEQRAKDAQEEVRLSELETLQVLNKIEIETDDKKNIVRMPRNLQAGWEDVFRRCENIKANSSKEFQLSAKGRISTIAGKTSR